MLEVQLDRRLLGVAGRVLPSIGGCIDDLGIKHVNLIRRFGGQDFRESDLFAVRKSAKSLGITEELVAAGLPEVVLFADVLPAVINILDLVLDVLRVVLEVIDLEGLACKVVLINEGAGILRHRGETDQAVAFGRDVVGLVASHGGEQQDGCGI